MPTQSPTVSAPLTFDLPVSLIAKAEALRRREKLGSTSEVVRLAIREFDFGGYVAASEKHRQVSVRLAPRMKNFLVRTARKKGVSAGELLRAAMEALPVGSKAKRL
jgi:Arc/MetJ-type ribon-helix-helix transcriptional regulator